MLNTEQFILLAGNPTKWDVETLRRVGSGSKLTDIQQEQHRHGRRSARLVEAVLGWCVRLESSFDHHKLIVDCNETEGLKEKAVELGKKWAEEDPDNREFFALKKDVREFSQS